MASYLEIARRALERLQGSALLKEPEAEEVLQEQPEQPSEVVQVETACRCAKWPFAHIHNAEDRARAIREWNRDSKWKIQ